jgi:hypothetical protein
MLHAITLNYQYENSKLSMARKLHFLLLLRPIIYHFREVSNATLS